MDYWAYGLGISSNVEIPALGNSRTSGSCDIEFQVGQAPEWVAQATPDPGVVVHCPSMPGQADSSLTITDWFSGKFLQLRYEDGTRFVLDGAATRIWAEAGGGLSHDDVFTYFVGPVMGFVLQRRKKLALHASAVVLGGTAFAFCGEAGTGKSTTAAALALRGNPALSDDICLLQDLYARKHVVPGYPRVTLWPDSVSQLFASAEALPLVVAGWEKRFLPLDGSVAGFANRPVPLGAIYLLGPRSNEPGAPFVERLSQRQAALALVQNTYMNYLLSKEQRAAEFYAIANLVSEVNCFRVTPHTDAARLRDLAALIESHAAKIRSGFWSSSGHAASANVQP